MINNLENIRLLLYPLGLLPSIFFTLRFLIQWLQSEKQHHSVISPLFWKLSLTGNLILLFHYTIQLQYPFALIQASNAVISWRNLDLFGSSKKPVPFKTVIWLFILAFLFVTAAFVFEGLLFNDGLEWIRVPNNAFTSSLQNLGWSWHLLGFFGAALFASRFWVQWWLSEKKGKSELGPLFWKLSIIGSIISLIYFVKILDIISILNYSVALIPYMRNLVLIKREPAG